MDPLVAGVEPAEPGSPRRRNGQDGVVQTPADLPPKFETVFQSWDTANKPTEWSNCSVCTTWGAKNKHLLNVFRKRLGYPDLKRGVRDQAEAFCVQTVLIEDAASGAQLIKT